MSLKQFKNEVCNLESRYTISIGLYSDTNKLIIPEYSKKAPIFGFSDSSDNINYRWVEPNSWNNLPIELQNSIGGFNGLIKKQSIKILNINTIKIIDKWINKYKKEFSLCQASADPKHIARLDKNDDFKKINNILIRLVWIKYWIKYAIEKYEERTFIVFDIGTFIIQDNKDNIILPNNTLEKKQCVSK